MKQRYNYIFTVLIAVLSLLSTAFLWKQSLILLIVLTVLAIIMLLMNKSKQELKTFVFCAILGALAESIAIAFGAWSYTNPTMLNIPIWLFVLWGIASIFMVRVYLFFKK